MKIRKANSLAIFIRNLIRILLTSFIIGYGLFTGFSLAYGLIFLA